MIRRRLAKSLLRNPVVSTLDDHLTNLRIEPATGCVRCLQDTSQMMPVQIVNGDLSRRQEGYTNGVQACRHVHTNFIVIILGHGRKLIDIEHSDSFAVEKHLQLLPP